MAKLSGDIFIKIHRSHGLLRREEMKRLSGLELQRGQGRLLRILAREGEISQKDLVTRLNIKPASLSELIGKLEEKGFVMKKIDEGDRRKYIVDLTDRGREIIGEMEELREELSEELFNDFTMEEKRTFNRLLDKLLDSVVE